MRSEYLERETVCQLQFNRLKKLLRHADENCGFYRSRFKSCEFDALKFNDLGRFSSVVPLTKSDTQNHVSTMVASNSPRKDLIENFTGGSTGEPLRLFYDRLRHESRIGATMRHDAWAGRRCGDRTAFFWGAPVDAPHASLRSRVRRWLEGQQLWLNTGNLKVDDFPEFNRRLKKFQPSIIIAYANSLALFARFLKASNIPAYSPNAIITSAEVLTDESRALIQETFGCPVFNRYGCREVSVIASECEQHDGLHVMAEGLYVEVVDGEGKPVAEGETGDILVTDLLNYGMPLIRYRIGDRGSWAPGDCACGRGLPRLRSIAGRVTDFVVGSDQQLISGPFLTMYVVARRPTLGRVQIIQSRLGHVRFRVCPGNGFDLEADKNYLFNAMRKYVGPLEMDLEIVAEIPPERSGKLLFCKSEIPQTDLPLPLRHGLSAQT
jgi:phenylacetate-CoA ligase